MKRRNFMGLLLGLAGLPFLPKLAKSKVETHTLALDELPIHNCLPIGHIPPPFVGMLPPGYLPCDGRAVSRLEYNELFQVLGDTYGHGDGLTTFNVPDLSMRIPAHIYDPGHSHSIPLLPSHTHGISDPGHRHGNMLYGEYVIKAKTPTYG